MDGGNGGKGRRARAGEGGWRRPIIFATGARPDLLPLDSRRPDLLPLAATRRNVRAQRRRARQENRGGVACPSTKACEKPLPAAQLPLLPGDGRRQGGVSVWPLRRGCRATRDRQCKWKEVQRRWSTLPWGLFMSGLLRLTSCARVSKVLRPHRADWRGLHFIASCLTRDSNLLDVAIRKRPLMRARGEAALLSHRSFHGDGYTTSSGRNRLWSWHPGSVGVQSLVSRIGCGRDLFLV